MVSQLMEYSSLLDQADECEDPCLRLVYVCEYTCAFIFIRLMQELPGDVWIHVP